jgi:hypothetical protein
MSEFAPGRLYLGTVLDGAREPTAERLEVEAGDLTTHGVIVGMTGSGKTGLAIGLVEEALLNGIPVLALDPKGDLGNLLLTFPELRPEDFRPWVSESDARNEGLSVDEYAARTAAQWRAGLEAQGMVPDRIRRLHDGAEYTIYTPGSSAGVPLNVVGSLRAPALSWDTEAETLRDEIEGAVTSMLALVGIDADPISSREHILLANVLEHAWRQGRDLDLGALIGAVQQPPLRKLGVFELDAFFPPKERAELAVRLNALAASPSFAEWSLGPPIDMGSLLGTTPDGRPRASVVYLAHLSDDERQFVVTLLLAKLVTWFRGLPGTSDLRALVYFDEVFGFVPPTAVPPAKKPILTILKQARAFGVGMVLATQNPVDLDYKAMANAATWLVGRLQTENDKARVLEGLRSAAGGVDVDALDAAIGGLEKRQFLLQSAHEPVPRIFGTRWAMSYLRGPLTREQIATLMHERTAAPAAAAAAAGPGPAPPPPAPAAALGEAETSVAPQVATGIPVYHLDPAAAWAGTIGAQPGGKLHAALAVRCALRYDDTRKGVDHREEWEAVYELADGFDAGAAIDVDYDERDFRASAPAGAVYVLPGVTLSEGSFFEDAGDAVARSLVAGRTLAVRRNAALKLFSRPGETAEQFAARCDEAAQQRADAEAGKIRARLEAQADRLRRAIEEAQIRAEELEQDERARANRDLVAGVGSVLGALLGGRSRARSIARAAERAMRSREAGSRTWGAQARASRKQAELEALELEILDEVQRIDAEWDARAREVDEVEVGLEASDVKVVETALLWVPRA